MDLQSTDRPTDRPTMNVDDMDDAEVDGGKLLVRGQKRSGASLEHEGGSQYTDMGG